MTKDEHIYEQFCEDNVLQHNENNSLWAIRFAKYYIKKQGQSLPIDNVVGQSEQLLVFAKWIQENGNHMTPEKQVKYFLDDNK